MATLYKTNGEIREITISTDTKARLKQLQELIGGYIEPLFRIVDKIYLGDEEGLIKKLEINPHFGCPYGHFYGDIVCVKTPDEFD